MAQFTSVVGIDETIPSSPPLTPPPLSLLGIARRLVDLQGVTAKRQELVDRLASAQLQLDAYGGQPDSGDVPGEADSAADAREALVQQMGEWNNELESLVTSLADLSRWEGQFQYLPELGLPATERYAPGSVQSVSKAVGNNTPAFGWYDPFTAVGRDERSTFGWPDASYEDRAGRAERALVAHEAWQCEDEFWSGATIPTNYHLTCSPGTVLTSPHRTLSTAWPNPDAAPGTTLGTAVGLKASLAALDQAIADHDAGTGMIHATPYLIQLWASTYPYLRDSHGNVLTVNNNILVPGYGYGGAGPDQTPRTVTDGVTNSTTTLTSATAAFVAGDVGMPVSGAGIPSGTYIASVTNGTTVVMTQAATATATGVTITLPGTGGRMTGFAKQWAYATDAVFHLRGDIINYPYDLREESPILTRDNVIDVRAERQHALITNRLLRAAVLVDTTAA